MDNDDLTNRFNHHPPRDTDTITAHQEVRQGCLQLAQLIDSECPEGREKALAITNLEQTMMWANAAIARPTLTR
jgi:hypothetical protein